MKQLVLMDGGHNPMAVDSHRRASLGLGLGKLVAMPMANDAGPPMAQPHKGAQLRPTPQSNHRPGDHNLEARTSADKPLLCSKEPPPQHQPRRAPSCATRLCPTLLVAARRRGGDLCATPRPGGTSSWRTCRGTRTT